MVSQHRQNHLRTSDHASSATRWVWAPVRAPWFQPRASEYAHGPPPSETATLRERTCSCGRRRPAALPETTNSVTCGLTILPTPNSIWTRRRTLRLTFPRCPARSAGRTAPKSCGCRHTWPASRWRARAILTMRARAPLACSCEMNFRFNLLLCVLGYLWGGFCSKIKCFYIYSFF